MAISGLQTYEVRKAAARTDTAPLANALARAFFDDPIMRWAIPSDKQRARIDRRLFELFVRVYQRLDETYSAASGSGAALWAPPGTQAVPEHEADAFGAQIEEIVAADAPRFFELMTLMDEHHPHTPHYYLQLLGVDPDAQGRGIGSTMLKTVLARADRDRVPAYLEATSERNAKLYRKHGFVTTGTLTIPGGPPLYPMWREPAA